MYNPYKASPCPYYNSESIYNECSTYRCPYCVDTPMYNTDFSNQYAPFADEMKYGSRFDFSRSEEDDGLIEMKDYGPEPYVVNINEATKQNDAYRTALWTGRHLQLTLMSLNVGEDIGLEIHPNIDQFIRIEEGEGLVKMGDRKDKLDFQERVYDDFAFIVPAGKWHNLINTGNIPLKVYSIYAPPQHPRGTVHETKADAQAAEENRG